MALSCFTECVGLQFHLTLWETDPEDYHVWSIEGNYSLFRDDDGGIHMKTEQLVRTISSIFRFLASLLSHMIWHGLVTSHTLSRWLFRGFSSTDLADQEVFRPHDYIPNGWKSSEHTDKRICSCGLGDLSSPNCWKDVGPTSKQRVKWHLSTSASQLQTLSNQSIYFILKDQTTVYVKGVSHGVSPPQLSASFSSLCCNLAVLDQFHWSSREKKALINPPNVQYLPLLAQNNDVRLPTSKWT